jgi:hypothetical protein
LQRNRWLFQRYNLIGTICWQLLWLFQWQEHMLVVLLHFVAWALLVVIAFPTVILQHLVHPNGYHVIVSQPILWSSCCIAFRSN